MSTPFLLAVVVAAIALLLVLVIKFKLNAFIALLLVSIFAGLAAGMPPQLLIGSIQEGMGSILGFVAIVVGLGSIFGEMMEYSGGARALATKLIGRLGQNRANVALTITGFLVAIPVFFDVGFIILVPVIYALSRQTGKSLVYYAVPLLTGLAITHAFIPPTPGPVAVTEILKADLGWVILFGSIIGLPLALILGPYLGKKIGAIVLAFPGPADEPETLERDLPSFTTVFVMLAFPIVLIVFKSVADLGIEKGFLSQSWITDLFSFVGHPFVALLVATLISLYIFGTKRGASKDDLLRLTTKALGPAGIIILITGAGGVFKQVLVDSGIGNSLAETLAGWSLPILILAYFLAVVVRVTQGSATVAMITAAGLLSPLLDTMTPSPAERALIVLAVAAGSTILSHVNDSGFWMVGKYLGLTEKQTIQTWTTASTAISVSGLVLILIVSLFV
jgi:Gnt-I system low-affinity gluconate transporter